MRAYKILLGECTTARELAVVAGKMLADENCRNVDKHTVVKAAFIKSLLPFRSPLDALIQLIHTNPSRLTYPSYLTDIPFV